VDGAIPLKPGSLTSLGMSQLAIWELR
jgi:hypothetical protein